MPIIVKCKSEAKYNELTVFLSKNIFFFYISQRRSLERNVNFLFETTSRDNCSIKNIVQSLIIQVLIYFFRWLLVGFVWWCLKHCFQFSPSSSICVHMYGLLSSRCCWSSLLLIQSSFQIRSQSVFFCVSCMFFSSVVAASADFILVTCMLLSSPHLTALRLSHPVPSSSSQSSLDSRCSVSPYLPIAHSSIYFLLNFFGVISSSFFVAAAASHWDTPHLGPLWLWTLYN